ncbi:BadF/BadG/BcrA/BcrD ATPase family protein [Streptantibioticus silvisoli]|uniref:ATPase BadF/BadG/BcrA/BcrD type domain-containing protein n=1 Tax=Streptantibioticus silvisoli TaxID=2705255 RepID=A0ABT6VUQ2_9ACTN|nr:BadF/BadG/BcrA/BcrD ATPase family protein [Streptantibioticus silvisoli]MDI5962182.1 hypothetical protein [Streptantibioticus silvisoli]
MTARGEPPQRLWAVDAGGSGTTALADDGTRWHRRSANPSSVGAPAADDHLLELLREVAGHLGGAPSAGWLATASVTDAAPGEPARSLSAVAARAGLTGTLTVSRDVTPLLLAPPLDGRGLVVVSGTGSGAVACDGVRPPVAAGGCEYLGSDEGSAFALGLAGLRAAIRGADGRAPATRLGPALAAHAAATRHATPAAAPVSLPGGVPGGRTLAPPGVPAGRADEDVRDLARRLAAEPFPKPAVAALAPAVCACWLDGDEAATGVVRDALRDLTAAARAARDAAGLTGRWHAVLSGGVFRGCPPFADALAARLAALGPAAVPVVAHDPAAAVLSALTAQRARDRAGRPRPRWTARQTLTTRGGVR